MVVGVCVFSDNLCGLKLVPVKWRYLVPPTSPHQGATRRVTQTVGRQAGQEQRKGERMWVLLNHVKADKLEQHKHFVQDILMPAVEKVDPAAFRHTRFLSPAE